MATRLLQFFLVKMWNLSLTIYALIKIQYTFEILFLGNDMQFLGNHKVNNICKTLYWSTPVF